MQTDTYNDGNNVRQSDNSRGSTSSSLSSIQSQSDLNQSLLAEIAALRQENEALKSRYNLKWLRLDEFGLPIAPINRYDELKELDELLANNINIRQQFVSGF